MAHQIKSSLCLCAGSYPLSQTHLSLPLSFLLCHLHVSQWKGHFNPPACLNFQCLLQHPAFQEDFLAACLSYTLFLKYSWKLSQPPSHAHSDDRTWHFTAMPSVSLSLNHLEMSWQCLEQNRSLYSGTGVHIERGKMAGYPYQLGQIMEGFRYQIVFSTKELCQLSWY